MTFFFFECIRKILVCKLGKKIYKNNNKNQSKTRGRFSASAMHNIMLTAAMSGRSVERIYYNIIYYYYNIYVIITCTLPTYRHIILLAECGRNIIVVHFIHSLMRNLIPMGTLHFVHAVITIQYNNIILYHGYTLYGYILYRYSYRCDNIGTRNNTCYKFIRIYDDFAVFYNIYR